MKIEVISEDIHLNYHLKFCRNRTKTSIIFLDFNFFQIPFYGVMGSPEKE